MATLIEQLPTMIKELEESHGSDNPFVKDLKEQLRASIANQGKTAQQVYQMQAVKFPKEDKQLEKE